MLLACTRHLLRELKGENDNPIWRWVQSRMGELKDLLQSEITLDKLNVEAQLTQFAKITATLKASPTAREKIRQLVEPHTVSLIEALNEFIASVLIDVIDQRKLVVIADNLDRIVPVINGSGGRSNHEQIFIDRSQQLKKLNCHVIYTVPISLVYSSRGTTLEDCFGPVQVLPMIMLQFRDGTVNQRGLERVKSLVEKRIEHAVPDLQLTEVFESTDVFDNLCLMSGGHMRGLILLIKTAIERTGDLPITARAARRAMTELRITYQNSISEEEWQLLAKTHRDKRIQNDALHRDLLFRRCILEYRLFDGEDECITWHDVHPLIRGIENFQSALQRIE